jgi:DnaK suppressor protein
MSMLSQQQLDQLAAKLNTDRRSLLEEVREELEHSGERHAIDLLNREPGDSGDESLANTLANFNITMLDRQIQELRDIEAACVRLKEGDYGVCVDCGQDIAFPRLLAYPVAKRCIGCQERHEKLYPHEGQPKI